MTERFLFISIQILPCDSPGVFPLFLPCDSSECCLLRNISSIQKGLLSTIPFWQSFMMEKTFFIRYLPVEREIFLSRDDTDTL